MKGDLTLMLLRTIQSVGMTTIDILDVLNYYGYNETYRRMRGFQSKAPEHRIILEGKIKEIEKRQKISKLLYKLKADGFIIKNTKTKNNKYFWELTPKGAEKLSKKQTPGKNYEVKYSNELKIITFDVPESQRRGRDWLRSILKNLKFKMVQKSVWMGKIALPEDFFKDLDYWGLIPYIEIFAVTKSGSLKEL